MILISTPTSSWEALSRHNFKGIVLSHTKGIVLSHTLAKYLVTFLTESPKYKYIKYMEQTTYSSLWSVISLISLCLAVLFGNTNIYREILNTFVAGKITVFYSLMEDIFRKFDFLNIECE